MRTKTAKKTSRLPFSQVHGNVDNLMEVFHSAAKKNPEKNDTLHLLFKLAVLEYVRRTGWNPDEFANACEKFSAGQPVAADAPMLQSAIS